MINALTKAAPEDPAFKLEFFGPVALLFSVNDEEEAIALANHSPLGLGDCVYTIRIQHSKQVASRIETGVALK
jgi:succinate-semialdehyde dehydrogenase/glutarate-semialdehyde dehydrogenase